MTYADTSVFTPILTISQSANVQFSLKELENMVNVFICSIGIFTFKNPGAYVMQLVQLFQEEHYLRIIRRNVNGVQSKILITTGA